MKDNLSDAAPQHRAPKAKPKAKDSGMLEADRPGWAWEFLRRNSDYRAASSAVDGVKRRSTSGLTVIEACDCAPEVRAFGICFR